MDSLWSLWALAIYVAGAFLISVVTIALVRWKDSFSNLQMAGFFVAFTWPFSLPPLVIWGLAVSIVLLAGSTVLLVEKVFRKIILAKKALAQITEEPIKEEK